MKQLTIRGVGIDLHQAIKTAAEKRGLSINRYVLYTLREAVGLGYGGSEQDVSFDDLDHLAGTWTQDELEEFERHLDNQRKIESDLWS